MRRDSLGVTSAILLTFVLTMASRLEAQQQSVRPGINDSFQNPDVEEFVGRFEREGRDAYDHRKEIVAACQLKPGMSVADIGAGTGLFTRLFASQVAPNGRVFAVDIAENFVKHVERTARKAGLNNVVGVRCSPKSVKLPPESIDLAFICDTYHHFEFPQETMRSIHRALRPDGQVILIDFRRIEGVSSEWILNHVRAGQETFTQEILAAGFRQVEEKKDLLRESYFVRFQKVAAEHKNSQVDPQQPLVPLPATAPAPESNPTTPDKVALGKRLFFDPRLSGSNDMSCATCHIPEKAFTDNRARARGQEGKLLRRNTPTLLNVGFLSRFFGDGERTASNSRLFYQFNL